MRPINFHSATTLAEALAFKAQYAAEGHLLAGGTDLLVALRAQGAAAPPAVVLDITAIADLRGITLGDQVTLGALTTHTEIEQSEVLQRVAPLLCAACAEIGSPQIRNRGTLGGNICNAAACADTLTPLMALDAEVTFRSAGGMRTLPLAEAITGPNQTALAPDELLTHIRFHPLSNSTGSAFVKLGRRKALSISRMTMAVILGNNGAGRLTDVRVAAGSVAPTARRFARIENLLNGEMPAPALFSQAGDALASEMIAITGRRWSTPYKEPVVAALLRRALACAAED